MVVVWVCLGDQELRRSSLARRARRSDCIEPPRSDCVDALLMAQMRRVHACKSAGAIVWARRKETRQRSTQSQTRVRLVHAPHHCQSSDLVERSRSNKQADPNPTSPANQRTRIPPRAVSQSACRTSAHADQRVTCRRRPQIQPLNHQRSTAVKLGWGFRGFGVSGV